MVMHLKANSKPVNQSISLNAHLLVQSQWWVLSKCLSASYVTLNRSLVKKYFFNAVSSHCRSVLSLCWVSFTGAGPPWFWVWRNCEGWRVSSTQPPCSTLRGSALLARAASACSGSTSVRFFPLQVGTQSTLSLTVWWLIDGRRSLSLQQQKSLIQTVTIH